MREINITVTRFEQYTRSAFWWRYVFELSVSTYHWL